MNTIAIHWDILTIVLTTLVITSGVALLCTTCAYVKHGINHD